MTETKKKECILCGGVGFITITEEDPKFRKVQEAWGDLAEMYLPKTRCECSLRKRFRQWVGEGIYRADEVNESVLMGKETKNLFINAQRTEFLSHLKFILQHHDFSYSWKRCTDAELLDIYLGKNDLYTSVSSYAKSPELLIIHLGVLSYKNISMPGILLEALKCREFQAKPTWVINPLGYPLREGHLCWNGEVEYHIESEYEILNFNSKVTETPKSQKTKQKLKTNNIDLL